MNNAEYLWVKELFEEKEKQSEEPELTEWFHHRNFLTTDRRSEIQLLQTKSVRNKQNGTFRLILNPTMNCNFNCWYCYETKSKVKSTQDIINKIKKFAGNTIAREDITCFALSWFGGEPLLVFNTIIYDLATWIKKCADKKDVKFSNSMITNGYFLGCDVIKKCNDIDLHAVQITIDGDRETHNKIRNQKGKPTFDRIILNCINYCLFNEKNRVLLRINYTNDSIKTDYSEILNMIPPEIRHQFKVSFQRVWQTYGTTQNKTDSCNSLQENKMKLRSGNFNVSSDLFSYKFKGYRCYADKNDYININYDGQVYRCTAMDYTPENSLGYLDEEGRIVWKDQDIPHALDSLPYFSNPKCLHCRYLALCNGPCFKERLRMYKNGAKEPACIIENLDVGIEGLIQDYVANYRNKRNNPNHVF